MKKVFLLLAWVGIVVSMQGQTLQKSLQPAGMKALDLKHNTSINLSQAKNITCADTVYYPLFKEYFLGTPTYYKWTLPAGFSASQAYMNSASISVTGIVFNADTNGTASVTLTASLYNVSGYQPTTQIAGTTGTVTVTGSGEYGITFAAPVTVTGNFAVVITAPAGSGFGMLSNDAQTNGIGEGLAYYKNSTTWTALSSIENDDFMAFPVVSYAITTSFTANDYDVCPGTNITFTGTYSPASVLTNRMFNYNAFNVYYGLQADTLFAWSWDDGTASYTTNPATHAYDTSGSIDPAFVVWGGLYMNCLDYYTTPVTVFSKPTITASASPTAVCPGSSSSLTASGASTYLWNTGSSSNPLSVTPTTATTYSVTGTDANTCTNSGTVTVSVNTPPVVGVSATSTTICAGSSTTLTASGALNYGWSTGGTGASITVSPTTTTTYTVAGVDMNTCTNTASITITVNPKPTITATASSPTICYGQNVILTASGGVSSVWNTGATSSVITVSPTATTTYTVTGTSSFGCFNTATVTVGVNSLPIVTAGASATPICSGSSSVLTAGGANTYSWNQGLGTGASHTVTPTGTTTYVVTGTDGNSCSNTASVTVTVNALPNITASALPASICQGQNSVLTASNGVTYSWDHGLGVGNNFTVNPSSTTTYAVTGYDGNGCTKTSSVTVTVSVCSHPTAIISASDNDICVGQSITYTDASSGVNVDTWTWAFTGGSISSATTAGPHTVTYSTSGNYTVTLSVADDNGNDDTTINITVRNLPVVTASAGVNPVCAGSPTSLTAGGASTYVWTGGSSANPYSVSPTSATTYSVTGTDTYGCQNTASVTVNVNALPSITLIASNTTVCAGSPTTLTAGGGTSYSWNQGLSGTSNTVNPTVNTTYSITGTGSNGCQNTASVTIVILAAPTVSASANPTTVCAGQSSSLTGSGNALAYSWDGSSTTNPVTVNPTTTTTYTVTGANVSGCTATASVTVNVTAGPTVTINANPSTICQGMSSVLTASGANTYMWPGNVTTNPYTVTPGSTTTYSVTGTDMSGCSGSTTVTVTVNPLPTVSVTFPPEVATVCQDSLVSLTGGSPAGGTWSGTGVTGSTFLSNTLGNFTITYSYTDGNSCSNSATGTITVETCTAISEFSSNEMVVYPNPASDVITISFGNVDASQVEIALFDISGHLVRNEVLNLNGSSTEVSVNQLPAGVYTLKVTAGSDVFFTKITRI